PEPMSELDAKGEREGAFGKGDQSEDLSEVSNGLEPNARDEAWGRGARSRAADEAERCLSLARPGNGSSSLMAR
ncbi:hypothetical protein Q0P64_14055, partial [Staphylococcus aureus]|nr:hypothetical protein [Staphylococcus aureus]